MKLNDETIALVVSLVLLGCGVILTTFGAAEFNGATGFVELIRGAVKAAMGGFVLLIGWRNLRGIDAK